MNEYKASSDAAIQDDNQGQMDEIIPRMLEIHSNIFNSHSQEDFVSYFAFLKDLDTLINDYPQLESAFISKIFCPGFGTSIFESVLFYESHPEFIKFIPCNLAFISTILNFNVCFSFYSQSPLTEEVLKILCSSTEILKTKDILNSEQEVQYHIEIVEECLHVLFKTVKFYQSVEGGSPFDLNFLLNPHCLFYDIFPLSPLCEEYTTKFVEQIVIYLDFSQNVRDICDLFYFILVQVQSKNTIQNILSTLTLLLECSSNEMLELFIDRKVIQKFMDYRYKCGKTIYNEENISTILIPCLKFTKTAIDFHNYYKKQTTSQLLKIISIDFFISLYSHSSRKLNRQSTPSDQVILYSQIIKIIIDTFIVRIKQNPTDNELSKILDLFSHILDNFSLVDFDYKGKILSFIDVFLRNYQEEVYPRLIEKDVFAEDIPDFAFNSDKRDYIIIYLKIFNFMLQYSMKFDLDEDKAHLHSIYEEISQYIDQLINDTDTDPEVLELAQYAKSQFRSEDAQVDK